MLVGKERPQGRREVNGIVGNERVANHTVMHWAESIKWV